MKREDPIPDGVWPVMLTPFTASRAIDWAALDALIEFYLDAGAAGLFAVCQSSEMFDLAGDERIALAERVLARVAGRVPVVASGTFGNGVAEMAGNVRRMADTGVSAVVCLTGALADRDESEAAWQARATELLAATGDIALGLYECPQPYHRVLGADTLAWTGATGRFLFLKETSSRLPLIAAKIEAVRGTNEKFFNANAETLLPSLELGAHGFCGISANFVPELWAWLCRKWRDEPATAARLQSFLRAAETQFARNYPASAKHFLAARGLPMAPACRVSAGRPSPGNLAALADLRAEAGGWQRDLGVA